MAWEKPLSSPRPAPALFGELQPQLSFGILQWAQHVVFIFIKCIFFQTNWADFAEASYALTQVYRYIYFTQLHPIYSANVVLIILITWY